MHEIRDGERSIRVEPAPRFSVRYGIDFPHPCIGRQVFELDRLDADHFARELAPARTFGFVSELEGLGRAGLARGGSLENAIVLDETGDGTLAAWLEEVGLLEVWTDTTTDFIAQRLQAVVATPGFEAWWTDLHSTR